MRRLLFEAGLVLGLSLIAAGLSAFFHPKRPAWYLVEEADVVRWSIDLERGRELFESGRALWVDARPARQFEKSHFPGAISLDADQWAERVIAEQERLQAAMGNPVVVYCDGTRCEKSREIAKRLRELLGLQPVYLLRGNWREIGEVTMP